MNGKLTLITPPDIWENENTGILFINLTEKEQDDVSSWFSKSDISENLNLYLYEGQADPNWIFHSTNACKFKYINLNGLNKISQSLSGYWLGKDNFYYFVEDENVAAIYSHINVNRVTSVVQFLERVFK